MTRLRVGRVKPLLDLHRLCACDDLYLFLFLFCSFTTTSYTAFYQTNHETKEDTKSTHDYKDDVQMMVLIPGNVREDWSQNIATIHSISADIFNPPGCFVNWLHISFCKEPRIIFNQVFKLLYQSFTCELFQVSLSFLCFQSPS